MSGSKRAKVRVVTAYVPIANHTRSAAEYARLGEQLRESLVDFPQAIYYDTIRSLWMTPFIEHAARKHQVNHAQGDNPAKNSMEYHVVQHNKFEWLRRAAEEDNESETFIWLDYGCMRLPGFNKDTLTEFLRRVRKGDTAFPGCWEKREINDAYPCWRFCGTLFVVARQDVVPFADVFKSITRLRVLTTRNVTWEVNDLAAMELMHVGPSIRWYAADHNAKMLTGY